MPVMDGFEATKKIRALEKNKGTTNSVLVIALTASALEDDHKKCLECGMDETLTKPFSLQSLTNILAARGTLSLPQNKSNNDAASVNSKQGAVDKQTLSQVRKVSGNSFSNIIVMFKTETEKSIEMLVNTHNQKAVAHKIKSAALSIGAARLAELAKNIESNSEAVNEASIKKLLEYLDEFVERSKEIN